MRHCGIGILPMGHGLEAHATPNSVAQRTRVTESDLARAEHVCVKGADYEHE